MSFFTKFVFLFTALFIGFVAFKIHKLCEIPPLPYLDEKAYWGPGKPPAKEDTTIKAFQINIPEKVLKDLKTRLETARTFTPPLESIQQQYGFNTNLLKNIVDYWKKDYKWRERETFLNQFPQYTTNIQGLDLHFIHVKPKVPSNIKVLPLLLVHGWPGSVREFYKIIPLLTKPQKGYDFVFEVISPSLPGYAFSKGAAKPGLGDVQTAVVLKNLMKRLGHDKFYVQGGDWGGITLTHLATLFPKNVLGYHSNLCMVMSFKPLMKVFLGALCPSLIVEKQYEHQMYPLSTKFSLLLEESGYFHIQATKPDTVGVGLGESPIGLAAYILEKFSTGTNITYKYREDGGLLEKFTYDELLDNVMLYWVTNSFTTAMRYYAESFTNKQRAMGVNQIPISEEVPCACARFGQEIAYYTDWILKDKYTNLIQTSDYTKGGHFIALEEPDLLAQDVFSAVAKMRKLKV